MAHLLEQIEATDADSNGYITNGSAARLIIPRLENFYISEKTGFLIEQPLTKLPPFFEQWNVLGQRIPTLLATHTLRDAIDQMSLLDHEQLSGHRQWRLAYTILSFLGHGYVWQDGESGVVKKIPRQLAVPWYGVAIRLGMKPSVCQANGVLNNWQLIDSSGSMTMENMSLICEFPGDLNCRWFYLITAMIEKDCVPGLQAILKAKESILSGDVDSVRQSLESVADNIIHLKSILTLLHGRVDSDVFYHMIRPFLSGWGGSSAVLPDGLIFEGVSDEPLSVSGGSAAQSSTIQCFDAALGITHEPDKQKFLDNMRTYMPPAHARFIDELRAAPSIRDYVLGCKDKALVESYQRSVGALRDFRSYHIQITTKYIVAKSKSARGTGGTELTPFLKSIRDTTSAAAAANSFGGV